MFTKIADLCIKYLVWYLKKEKITRTELVIRTDGWTIYRRDFKREDSIKETLKKIK